MLTRLYRRWLDTPYAFTRDWYTRNIPLWRELLAPLKGRPVRALEIGSLEGRSATWLLDNVLTHEEARLTCVDYWGEAAIEARFDANVAAGGHEGKVRKLKGASRHVLKRLPEMTFDFVYVDGGHLARHVLEDAVLAFDALKIGGLLIFDDYVYAEDQGPDFQPKTAIDAFLKVYGPYVEVVRRGDQLALIKRRHVLTPAQLRTARPT